MIYRIGVVIYDGFNLMDLALPFKELIQERSDSSNRPMFEMVTVGRNKELVACHGGFQILPLHIYPDAKIYDVLLVPGGPGAQEAAKNLRLMQWFGRAAKPAKVVAAIGNGALILAAAKLLEHKRVAYTSEFAALYPGIDTTKDEGIVVDGKILTVGDIEDGVLLSQAVIQVFNRND